MAALSEAVPVGTVVKTNVPTRLDRLTWSAWHRRVVIALGITWILDGLEASLIAALGPVLQNASTLGLTGTEVGLSNTIYLLGEVAGALFFGHWTDKLGRKKLFLVTLAVYLVATLLSGTAFNFGMFAFFRFFAGAGIGGEYAAINSAIDELIPARVRGQVDLGINGSYWVGVVLGTILTEALNYFPESIGWRAAFGLGAFLGLTIIIVRRDVPESPRWLLMHGYVKDADATIETIEAAVLKGGGRGAADLRAMGTAPNVNIKVTGTVGFAYIAKQLFSRHLRRSALGLTLMIAQAFFYNAIFFTYGLILTKFYEIPEHHVGRYMIPFAIGNFLGPILLGRLFDTIGRRVMIALTYVLSGVLLTATGYAFSQGWLTPVTQVVCWCVVFFFASSAASSAYLTVSELFPVEIRGMAIALFFSIATGAGAIAPTVFGRVVESGSRGALFAAYGFASVLMIIAGTVAWVIGVNAEGKSLEELADIAPPSQR